MVLSLNTYFLSWGQDIFTEFFSVQNILSSGQHIFTFFDAKNYVFEFSHASFVRFCFEKLVIWVCGVSGLSIFFSICVEFDFRFVFGGLQDQVVATLQLMFFCKTGGEIGAVIALNRNSFIFSSIVFFKKWRSIYVFLQLCFCKNESQLDFLLSNHSHCYMFFFNVFLAVMVSKSTFFSKIKAIVLSFWGCVHQYCIPHLDWFSQYSTLVFVSFGYVLQKWFWNRSPIPSDNVIGIGISNTRRSMSNYEYDSVRIEYEYEYE